MKNDIAATAEHTHPTNTPPVLETHGTASTASAARPARNTEPGVWEVTFATTTSADRTADQSTLIPCGATASIQRDGRLYASATHRRPATAFDATHVMRADQIEPRRYQVKQYRNGNPLGPGANHPVTRCPLRTNSL